MFPFAPAFMPMQRAHLPGALALSVDAGWPHRRDDWELVLGISKGCVALVGDKVVATALVTPFGNAAMVNLVVVDRPLRGRGLGREIMTRAMTTLDPDSWHLVATEEGLPLYEKLGFRPCGEVAQHQGIAGAITPHGGAVWARPADLPAIIELDRKASKMDRGSLYRTLSHQARFAVLRISAGIAGFAAVRPFGKGHVIGPVVAGSDGQAQDLISLLMAEHAGKFLRVDTGTHTGLGPWLAACGLPEIAHGRLMQMGEAPAPDRAGAPRTFALASQALG